MSEQKINAPAALERWSRGEEGSPYLLQPLADGYWTPWHIAQQALEEARAAVAELIEADKEFDDAEAAMVETTRPEDPKTPDEWMADSRYRDARDRLRAARDRRAAALARFNGDVPPPTTPEQQAQEVNDRG